MAAAGMAGVAASAKAPQLLNGATGWLNSEPLDLAALRGKVVLVNFWTYTCINWLRTLPYVRGWANAYRDQGLVVIGVHTPEFSFEKNLDYVRSAVARTGIEYPIALDNDHAIWNAFGNQYWPALYFIDASGRLRDQHFGEGDYERSEATLQRLLSLHQKASRVEAQGIETAADWADLHSPENYLGAARTTGFRSRHEGAQYAIPAELRLNQWALAGDWTISDEAIVTNQPHGRMAYRFHARDLHLVMGSTSAHQPIRFRVSLDGAAPASAHGLDVDEQGFGSVTEPRLYQLLRQPGPITGRRFEIEFLDHGAAAYSVTFG